MSESEFRPDPPEEPDPEGEAGEGNNGHSGATSTEDIGDYYERDDSTPAEPNPN